MTEMDSLTQRLERAAQALFAPGNPPIEPPAVGVVLGSGLGPFADTLAGAQRIAFREVPGMAATAVEGHAGGFVFGRHGRLRLCAMQGRLHLYEGHAPDQVVFGVRLMIALGARTVILTNAAGGIRDDLQPGDLMSIEDQLNLTGHNCLLGPNDDTLGPRFVQLNDLYDAGLRALAQRVARERGFPLHSGVYAGLLGPSYETPAEVRMVRALGADALGMSTVLEAIAARHMGARCLGLSCITNRAAGLAPEPPDHADVQRTAAAVRDRFVALLAGVLDGLAEETAP
jgi:purine-nucleoside phosphorylase